MLSNLRAFIPDKMWKWYKKHRYHQILEKTAFESVPELAHCRALLKPGALFIDIGANIGLYSIKLAPFAGHVFAFEPIPETAYYLKAGIQKRGIRNVEVSVLGISDEPGILSFGIPAHQGIENFYRAEVAGSGKTYIRRYEIECTTLDDFFKNETRTIGLIKCDAEGHDWQCVRGAKKLIKQQKPPWMIEVNDDPEDKNTPAYLLFSYMRKMGYSIYCPEKNTLKKYTKGMKSVNYFFI